MQGDGMKILRPIAPKDQKGFERFAFTMSYGVTSLPKDPDLLKEKIVRSQKAFADNRSDPHGDLYIFVMENLETGELEGTSALRAKTAEDDPLYYYRVETLSNTSEIPHVPDEIKVLRASSYQTGPTELCGLYLLPEYRKAHSSKLLSYGRFLFIATHTKRFADRVYAEMRGVIDEEGECPFWNGIGRHFFEVPFEKVANLASYSKKFIPSILPSHPIYIPLLPKEVQEVIGKPHKNTEAALNLLLKQGFSFSHEIAIDDGGPRIAAFTHEIRTIRESKIGTIQEITNSLPEDKTYLIANQSLNFRACMHSIENRSNEKIVITKQVAEGLQVKIGDRVRYWEQF